MRNSSYNLIPILLKLCRHCDHALKICMWLGNTPQINFCHFFYNLNLVIFWTFLHLESGLPVGGIVFHFLVLLYAANYIFSLTPISSSQWRPGTWGPCSTTCELGIQTQQVSCMAVYDDGTMKIVDDELCINQYKSKPQYRRSCNEEVSCDRSADLPRWRFSAWSQVKNWFMKMCLDLLV